MSILPDDFYEWDDEDERKMLENCPYCGFEYDEVDYEYQICHYCKREAIKDG